jgi:Flp pilus assembly protein TadD
VSAESLLVHAEHEYGRGAFVDAIETLRRALEADPAHAAAHALLARVLVRQRRLHGADGEARRALELAPEDPRVQLAMAELCLARKDLANAAHHAALALDDSRDPDAPVVAARVALAAGDPFAASRHLDTAIARAPRDPRVLAMYARVALASGDLAAAANHAARAIAAGPRDVDAQVAAGLVAVATGDLAAADRHVRMALHLAPADAACFELWGAIQRRRGTVPYLIWLVSSAVALRGERGRFAIAIVSFVIARLLIIVAYTLDLDGAAMALGWLWIAFSAYTWLAPELLRRSLQNHVPPG